MLERLSHEREAARQSAEEAQRTMQHVLERKHQQATQKLSMVEHPLSHEQQDALIEQLVNEMLPVLAERLHSKLKLLLNR